MAIDTPPWVQNAVFYQIFPDRFARSERVDPSADLAELEAWDSPPTVYGFKGGDLYGVAERLDYLVDLGITALYFCPIFSSAANHRYHTFDYHQVDPLLGGNAALRHLLDAAHEREMRVVLDGVFNHASRGFWPFHHVLENGAASPYRDWFHFDPARLQGDRPFQPYPAQEAQQALASGQGSYEAIGYGAWWNLPALPKFNTDCPAVREFLLEVATHWIEFGIDGWRLDVPNEIDDDEFWREFRRRVRDINPEAYIVGEVWGEAARWLQGDMWDAVMNYQITAAALGYFGGHELNLEETRRPSSFSHVEPLHAGQFAEEVRRVTQMYAPEVAAAQLNLLDSHDMPRFLTCCSDDVEALRMALAVRVPDSRRPLRVLRRRSGTRRSPRSGLPPQLPVGRISLERRFAALVSAMYPAAKTAFLHANPDARTSDAGRAHTDCPSRRRGGPDRGVQFRHLADNCRFVAAFVRPRGEFRADVVRVVHPATSCRIHHGGWSQRHRVGGRLISAVSEHCHRDSTTIAEHRARPCAVCRTRGGPYSRRTVFVACCIRGLL